MTRRSKRPPKAPRPPRAKPINQARKVLRPKIAFGTSRHHHKTPWLIHSVGTFNTYVRALAGAIRWETAQGGAGVTSITKERAQAYLDYRRKLVSQKTLDADRQALQALLEAHLPVVRSLVRSRGHGQRSRLYSQEQILEIFRALNPGNALAAQLVVTAGLRTHELFTLRPLEEQPASKDRPWRDDLFFGIEGIPYSVKGKGGLVREVRLPEKLVPQLEQRRLPAPRRLTDRGIYYDTWYDLPGGQRLSQAFSDTSLEVLGFSRGLHGLRHVYVQARIDHLQRLGYSWDDARAIVSQEVGHFRKQVTNAYLR